MKAISNENIIDNLCGGCGPCSDLVPSITYAYSGTTVTVTDASTYPAGTDLIIVHVAIYDQAGNKAVGSITGSSVAVNVSALDPSEGLDMLVTIVTNGDCISDGHASNLKATGSAGFFDKENNSIFLGEAAASS